MIELCETALNFVKLRGTSQNLADYSKLRKATPESYRNRSAPDRMLSLFPPEKAAPQPEYTTSGSYDPKLRELAEIARSASAVAEDDEPKEN